MLMLEYTLFFVTSVSVASQYDMEYGWDRDLEFLTAHKSNLTSAYPTEFLFQKSFFKMLSAKLSE